MRDMNDIEILAEEYSKAHDALADKVSQANAELQAVKRKYRHELKSLASNAANTKADLIAAIEESRELFRKPKTRTFHGIKVGLRKAKGKLKWTDAEKVVKAIKRVYDDQIGTLIKTTEKPNKDALEKLPAAELKKLGITVEDSGDQVVANPAEGEIDKMVDALLEGMEQQEEESDAA
ncbi:MAG: host-nuclease inhibitor Gam family protein [Gammaproteobacteria bacterium]